jgi:hypothetical protein
MLPIQTELRTSLPSIQSSAQKGSRLDHHNETNIILAERPQTETNNTIHEHPTSTVATSI